MLKFPAIGVWRPGEISISWTQSSRRVVPEVEQAIEETWTRSKVRLGEYLFDGPMCRLESFNAQPGRFELMLSRTNFKLFMGTNLGNAHLADKFGREILASPVGLSTILISADGFLVLGRRNDRVAYYPGRLHPFSGCLEPSDHVDVFDEARRELDEELSLRADDVADLICTGIVEDVSLRQPEMCFAARSSKSAAQIESQLDEAEHAGVWKIRAEEKEIESALKSEQNFTPVAMGAILLWGRTKFGENWFETQRKT